MVNFEATAETSEIPDARIKGAEAFRTWGGGHVWQDHYAKMPHEWADNEIRSYNQDLLKNLGKKELINNRDILYQWRNAYLEEYNSFAPVRPVGIDLEENFEKLFFEALESNYKDNAEGRNRAMSQYQAFKDARKWTMKLKNLPSSESGIVGKGGIGSRE